MRTISKLIAFTALSVLVAQTVSAACPGFPRNNQHSYGYGYNNYNVTYDQYPQQYPQQGGYVQQQGYSYQQGAPVYYDQQYQQQDFYRSNQSYPVGGQVYQQDTMYRNDGFRGDFNTRNDNFRGDVSRDSYNYRSDINPSGNFDSNFVDQNQPQDQTNFRDSSVNTNVNTANQPAIRR